MTLGKSYHIKCDGRRLLIDRMIEAGDIARPSREGGSTDQFTADLMSSRADRWALTKDCLTYSGERPAANLIRADCKAAGWTRRREMDKTYDLCPVCTKTFPRS